MNVPTQNMVAAYWLPSVGIGAATPPPPVLPGNQTVVVPVTDALNYKRPDGTPQLTVINLWGCTFTTSSKFEPPYVNFDAALMTVLTNGSVQKLQKAGIGVVLTIVGGNGPYGWSSIPADQIQDFVNYLNGLLTEYDLDGIDIDDEYAGGGDTLVQTVAAMAATFPAGTIISKALFQDLYYIPQLKNYLTYGGIMNYGDSASYLEGVYEDYINEGMTNSQLMIGVNAGPVAQPGTNFTSVETTQELTEWQPTGGTKLGMMVWSFSQDIQQFTAYPQNQVSLAFPNANDHQWQTSIISAMFPSGS